MAVKTRQLRSSERTSRSQGDSRPPRPTHVPAKATRRKASKPASQKTKSAVIQPEADDAEPAKEILDGEQHDDKPAATICFLRGVNVGGNGRVPMNELKALLEEEHGCEKVKTLLQSGNVVFKARGTLPELKKRLETAIEDAFNYQSDVHLMRPDQLRKIIEANPYPEEAKTDPSHLLGLIVSSAPEEGAEDRLKPLAVNELFTISEDVVYIYYGKRMAGSKMAGTALDRALGVRGTGRNWNTLNKVLALAEAL